MKSSTSNRSSLALLWTVFGVLIILLLALITLLGRIRNPFAFGYVFVLGSIGAGLCIAVLLYLSGVPVDAFRAYRGTHVGDRMRLFCYYQFVRQFGVPAALLKYGVRTAGGLE